MVFEVDLTERSCDSGANFEDISWDGVANDEMALVIQSLREGLVVDESVAGFEARWGRGDDGVEVGDQFNSSWSDFAFHHLALATATPVDFTGEMTP